VQATRGRRNAATPVIVRKGALAENVPHHDLRVTKGHAFYLDDALIPIEFLINHRSIELDDRAQEVELYHIEFESHVVWGRLLERADPRKAPPLTNDPDLHLLVDGKRVDVIECRDDMYVLHLATRPRSVRVCSRSAVPQELGIACDNRPLGVAVRRIVLA
jgi:Hint domain